MIVLFGLAEANAAGNLIDDPDNADLIYENFSGNVMLDATEAPGSEITSFVLGDIEGGLNAPGFATFPSGGLTTDLTIEISWSDVFNGFTGVHDVGDIFPTGLDLVGLEAFLDDADYVGSFGTGAQVFDLVVVVPEPSSLVFLAIGGVALYTLVRRRG